MIYPDTGWMEIKEFPENFSDLNENLIEQLWFTRYPWLKNLILNRCEEFMEEVPKMMIKHDYCFKLKFIRMRIT